jgi:hypothetical protein
VRGGASVASKVADFRSHALRRDFERRKRDRQLEAPPSRAAGIDVENATDRMDLRHVGMPGDDDVDAGAGIGRQRLQVVQNVDRLSRQAYEFRVGVFAGPLAAVHVSTDGRDGRDPAKGVDDFGAPDVAGMNDVIDARQASFCLGPQQAMRVRDDSNPERHFASGRRFDFEGIADQRRRVKMAFSGECDNALPSSLSDLPQRLDWTNRSDRAELLGKLAPRDLLWSISGIDFALRNGPGATVLLAPEWTAGVNEQDLESASAFPVGALNVDLLEVFSAQPYRSYLQSNREPNHGGGSSRPDDWVIAQQGSFETGQ